ncbi:hypothetical protein [Parapedobacter soli]|nr:hypothetical protein [Parapedobacter soli]
MPKLPADTGHDNPAGTTEMLAVGYGNKIQPGEYHLYSKTKLNE